MKIKIISRINKTHAVILLYLCLIFGLPVGVFAEEYTLKTIPNTHLTDRNNYVSNPDGIISSTDVRAINSALKNLEDSLGIEVAVVAVESIGSNDARMFATDLFKEWGIGKKGEDNGLLIQLITEPTQRSVVFETGYGLEGVLPDAITYRIQQRYMIPDMKEGNYSSGMLNGVMAVKDYLLASDYERSAIIGQSSGDEELPLGFLLILILGAPILILIFALISASFRNRPRTCPRCGQKTLVYIGRQTLQKPTYQAEGLAVDRYRCKNCGYTENNNRRMDRLRRSAGPLIIGGGLGGGLGGGSFGGGGFGGGSWGGGRSGGGGSISRF